MAGLELTREQVLAHRRRVGALDERLPPGPASLRRSAWVGLTDSGPRAALLSLHARVAGTGADALADPALVQVWGPRFSAYVVAAQDRAVLTVGRLPATGARRRLAEDLAARIETFLAGRELPYAEVGRGIGEHHNRLRYASTTGRVLIRWDGAHQPTIRAAPRPEIEEHDARLELVRRFLHVFGPATPEGLRRWAGIGAASAARAFAALGPELSPVRSLAGDGWIRAADEASFRAGPDRPALARLLPSGDPFFLLWGPDRELLVPDPARRSALWTSRVWPGAVLVGGEVVGTWRRSVETVTVTPWTALGADVRTAVEQEAASLPLPGPRRPVELRWDHP